jgi:hypothetical protein
MKKEQVIEVVTEGIHKGANIVVMWNRNAKTFKGVSDIITKHVRMVGRVGIEYDKQKAVIEKRANGELPSENAGLPWGTFEIYPYLITHKGENYLRLYNGTCPITKTEVHWFKNGAEVTKESIEGLLLASEKGDKTGDCFTVKTNDILRLHTEVVGTSEILVAKEETKAEETETIA